jgi:hypothetical protein
VFAADDLVRRLVAPDLLVADVRAFFRQLR